MDIFQSESNKKYHSSLPPIQQSVNNSWKTQESLSNKLQLYIKFRTSSKITINSPIESLLPSNLSKRNNSVPAPTQADIVMSSKPPLTNHKLQQNFKYSRLFEIKKIKDNSFLQMSFKAQEQPKPKKIQKPKNYRAVKGLQRMKNENFSRKSIPFLSDILNKVYRQGSKVLFSPHGPLESNEVLCSFDKKDQFNEEEGLNEEEFNPDEEVAKTLDAAMQTEKVVETVQKNKRRVIFNKNSSFRRKNLSEIESESECRSVD